MRIETMPILDPYQDPFLHQGAVVRQLPVSGCIGRLHGTITLVSTLAGWTQPASQQGGDKENDLAPAQLRKRYRVAAAGFLGHPLFPLIAADLRNRLEQITVPFDGVPSQVQMS